MVRIKNDNKHVFNDWENASFYVLALAVLLQEMAGASLWREAGKEGWVRRKRQCEQMKSEMQTVVCFLNVR